MDADIIAIIAKLALTMTASTIATMDANGYMKYYVHTKNCLLPFGLWPYQKASVKLMYRVGTTMAVMTILIPYVLVEQTLLAVKIR